MKIEVIKGASKKGKMFSDISEAQQYFNNITGSATLKINGSTVQTK